MTLETRGPCSLLSSISFVKVYREPNYPCQRYACTSNCTSDDRGLGFLAGVFLPQLRHKKLDEKTDPCKDADSEADTATITDDEGGMNTQNWRREEF